MKESLKSFYIFLLKYNYKVIGHETFADNCYIIYLVSHTYHKYHNYHYSMILTPEISELRGGHHSLDDIVQEYLGENNG